MAEIFSLRPPPQPIDLWRRRQINHHEMWARPARGRVVRQALVPSFVNQCFDMVNAGAIAEPSPNVADVERLDNGSSFLNLPRLYWGCRRKPDMAINGRRN